MFSPQISSALADLRQEIETLEKVLVERYRKRKMVSKHQSEEKFIQLSQVNLQLQQTPIAIVGMASIFPEAKNLQEFWENIIHEADCIKDVPASRWNVEEYYDPDPRAPDKTYCKRGGFIPDLDFNPMEFGLPPNLLEVTDISQLLALVVAKQAMEDANYGRSREFDREHTGVILGTVGRQLSAPLSARLQYPIWERVLKSSGIPDEDTDKIIEKLKLAYVKWEENSFPGMLSNLVAGRIANRLDFGGINCTVDAACASSLAAFKMAISELVERRCQMMLTGGVDTDNSAFTYLCFSKTPALSRTQRSRPFDAESDGMMLGEGLGMVVLKRLEDAERDRDRIYAVIRGIGTSSDGRYKSIYAPRPEGQVKALRRAYQDAGFSPACLGLVEAHGTGTMAGDPAEFTALRAVFDEEQPPNQSIALGSVKSQIGHTKTAAGVASVIKTALALHHKVLPPTINVAKPNPKLDIDNSPFYLNTKTRPWFRSSPETPRRAGVSSFGFGGTNFHIVLEEYQQEHERAFRLHRCPQSVLLCAPTSQQLLVRCQAVLQQLQTREGENALAQLIESCKTLKIDVSWARVGFVANSRQEACRQLQTAIQLLQAQSNSVWEHPQGIYYRQSGLKLEGKVVALFPGQGSQYLEMGRELTRDFPELRSIYRQLDEQLTQDGLQPISRVVFPPPSFEESRQAAQAQQLQRPEYAQPAIGGLSMGLYKLLQRAGFNPNFVAGHSFGELTALWAAEVLDDEDYLFLVKSRGRAMAIPLQTGTDSGAMLAVKGEATQVKAALKAFPKIAIANYNSPQQLVLAGAGADMAQVRQSLAAQGFSPVLLPVAAAFHTSAVAQAQKPFARALEAIALKPAKKRVYANLTGQLYPDDPQKIRTTLLEQITHSVRFREQIETIYAEGGYCFVEIGPRRVLTNLVKEILGDRPHLAIALNGSRQKASDRQLLEAVLQLRVAGLSLTDLDPYQLEPKSEAQDTAPKLQFSLNGACYVSEKTKQAFEQSLKNGHRLSSTSRETPKETSNGHQPNLSRLTDENGSQASASLQAPSAPRNGNLTSTMKQAQSNSQGNHQTLSPVTQSEFTARQGESRNGIKHGKHQTNGTHEFSGNLQKTMTSEQPREQMSSWDVSHPASASTPPPGSNYQHCLDSIETTISQFEQQQRGTLQIHQQYLDNQREYAQIFCQLMQQQQNLLFGNNAAAQTELKTALLESLERNLMRFHDHQTQTIRTHEQSLGYQSEVSRNLFQLMQQKYTLLMTDGAVYKPLGQRHLETADGAALSEQVASADAPNLQSDTETRPQEVAPEPNLCSDTETPPADPLTTVAPQEVAPEPKRDRDREMTATVETLITQTASPPANTIDVETISQALLKVVSDKTGYPPEMLELEMDLEADLGIDSIKRVEIMGGLMELFPDLPQPKLEELAEIELRTLTQVIDFIQELASRENVLHLSEGTGGTEEEKSFPTPESSSPQPLAPEFTPPSQDSLSVHNSSAVLDRSSVAVMSPPEVKAETELVLGNSLLLEEQATVKADAIADFPSREVAPDELEQAFFNIVSESTGYPVEMLERDLDLEKDLGIDLIKRVEILSALTEQFPHLRQPNPEELTNLELHTLKQIIDYIRTRAKVEQDQEQPHLAIRHAQVKLQYLPEPDWLDLTLSDGQVCLIADDGSQTTVELAQSLSDRGWKTVVLSFPESAIAQSLPLPMGVSRVRLQDWSDPHLQQQLKLIENQYGSIAVFIHLHPRISVSQPPAVCFSETEAAIVRQVFFIAKHLKASLTQVGERGFSSFFSVVRLDGAFGLEHQVNFGAMGGGLFGLVKSLNYEWRSVFCRAIDLSPEINPQQSAHYIVAELHDPNRYLTEVGYSFRGRTTLVSDATQP